MYHFLPEAAMGGAGEGAAKLSRMQRSSEEKRLKIIKKFVAANKIFLSFQTI
jgi:hypothetical protein